MDIQELDYDLPRACIAQFPSLTREDSRLMVLRRDTGEIHHTHFADLVSWVSRGDLLVVNDTRVIPARLRGRKLTGGQIEVLLYGPLSPDGKRIPPTERAGAFQALTWQCLVRSGGKLRDGMEVLFQGLDRGVLYRRNDGEWCIKFSEVKDLRQLLNDAGEIPLPPYIQRRPTSLDRLRYQTLFAQKDGSIAAPTAGLHFTEELIDRFRDHGVLITAVTLQVGVGTFLPVRAARVEDHVMDEEYVEVAEPACRAWRETRRQGGRVIAVGTTTVRALETAVDEQGKLRPFRGFTSLFVTPEYRFRAVDALITNFHLPRSTLLMLVMAIAGKDQIKAAYAEAIKQGYRFYSYGDAMLIH